MFRCGAREFHRCAVGDMNHLDERDTRQLATQFAVNGTLNAIADLDRVGAATPLLRGDGASVALASEQKGGDGWRRRFLQWLLR